MVMPDWFIALLVKLGLKETEEQKYAKKIANYRESERKLNERVEELIDRIHGLEAELHVQRTKYENAQGAEKNMLGAKIKPLIQQLKQMKEHETQISQQMHQVTLLIHNMEMLKQETKTQDIIPDIEIATIAKKDIIVESDIANKAAGKLNELTLESNDEAPISFDLPAEQEDDPLLRELDEFVPGKEEKHKEESLIA